MFDVIIIGAGYCGLSAALKLKESRKKFLLLEASNRPGGRALDQYVSENFRLELGGQYIAPIQKRVTQRIADLGLKTYQAWGKGDHINLKTFWHFLKFLLRHLKELTP